MTTLHDTALRVQAFLLTSVDETEARIRSTLFSG